LKKLGYKRFSTC